MKGGNVIKPIPIQIKAKGPLERIVMDGWKLHNESANLTGFILLYFFLPIPNYSN